MALHFDQTISNEGTSTKEATLTIAAADLTMSLQFLSYLTIEEEDFEQL